MTFLSSRRCMIFLLLGLAALGQGGLAQTIDARKEIKVLTFNILHGATTRGDFDLDAIAQVIVSADPDFVALQEVDFKTKRAMGYDLATEFGWRTKMTPLFGKAMPFDGGEYGCGILSKYSYLSTCVVDLPHSEDREPRVALQMKTRLPSGDTISMISTHLDHTGDQNDRLLQVQALNDVFLLGNCPVILAGDLNAIPGSTPIKKLEAFWGATYDKDDPAPTSPSDNPRRKIDYVMFYPKDRWKVIDTQVIQDEIASDHCAYLVTLELWND